MTFILSQAWSNMSKIHFEIGTSDDTGETHSVFSSASLREVIKEWKKQQYNDRTYFIDVWETDEEGTPYPIADIKLEPWVLED